MFSSNCRNMIEWRHLSLSLRGISSLLVCFYFIHLTTATSVGPLASVSSTAMENLNGPRATIHRKGSEPTGGVVVKTQTPIIGVLTQVLRDYKRFTNERQLHIAASYVKWIESAGAQVMPILLNQNDSYYEQVFQHTNGLLFPGGDNLLDPHKNTPMMVAAKKLYRLAVEANDKGDYYPIWGTCLGLELLSVLSSNKNVLIECSANDMTLPMEFKARGKLFAPSNYANLPMNGDYSKAIVDALSSRNLTYNYHHKCLTDEALKRAKLDKFYRPLAYSKDQNNIRFIAIFEAINYPFFGVQFHPEKAPFEFVVKKHQYHIPHTRESVAVSRYFADFFIGQAQINGHGRRDQAIVERALIYSYQPMYTALKRDMYEQRYLFPYNETTANSNSSSVVASTTSEEFMDYLPADDEEPPEDVLSEEEAGNSNILGQLGKLSAKLGKPIIWADYEEIITLKKF